MHDRAWICAHVPHQGNMCLLDVVLEWDEQHIVCGTRSHRSADNPLRAHGRLGSVCTIEYAAQAIALHGALLCSGIGAADAGLGVLASARQIELHVARLDDLAEELQVSAERLHSNSSGALYSFKLHADERLLARGRASVMLADVAVAGVRPGPS
jgi:predicted hotdog family 3-hydroxylacyl-ACP dehydratase